MATLGEKLRIAREKANLKQNDVSKFTGISNKAISRYETDYSSPTPDTLKILAKLYNVDINWLLDYSLPLSSITLINEWKEIPVYSQISCGNGCFNDNDIEEYIAVPANLVRSANSFGVYANGDSMVNAGIVEGEILIFSKSDEVNSGDIVCACYEGQMYCKRFKLINNAIVLVSENPNYDPIIIDENKNFSVLGKLIYSVKKY